jgi:A/G-specific adenine glycosylase
MLQQTQVKTVLPYWERWMKKLPDISAVAQASAHPIHKLWEGLGYYTRVRNLQRAAQIIMKEHHGKFPRDFDSVLALPGIGRYTAGAICSIAFKQPHPILDGNVMRVLCRWFGVEGDPKEKQVNARLWAIAGELTIKASAIADRNDIRRKRRAQNRVSELNQSLMELGALVCLPRQPLCRQCPISEGCLARRQRRAHLLPMLTRRPQITRQRFLAFVAQRRDRFLVRQRPAGVVNAYLWEFPNVEVSPNNGSDPLAIAGAGLETTPGAIMPLCTIKHSITRYRITLEAFRLKDGSTVNSPGHLERWVKGERLRELPFTSAHRKIVRHLLDNCPQ